MVLGFATKIAHFSPPSPTPSVEQFWGVCPSPATCLHILLDLSPVPMCEGSQPSLPPMSRVAAMLLASGKFRTHRSPGVSEGTPPSHCPVTASVHPQSLVLLG